VLVDMKTNDVEKKKRKITEFEMGKNGKNN
jgi:hypothetical protein